MIYWEIKLLKIWFTGTLSYLKFELYWKFDSLKIWITRTLSYSKWFAGSLSYSKLKLLELWVTRNMIYWEFELLKIWFIWSLNYLKFELATGGLSYSKFELLKVWVNWKFVTLDIWDIQKLSVGDYPDYGMSSSYRGDVIKSFVNYVLCRCWLSFYWFSLIYHILKTKLEKQLMSSIYLDFIITILLSLLLLWWFWFPERLILDINYVPAAENRVE